MEGLAHETIEYYTNLPYHLEILADPDKGGYIARYPNLPGCITVGDSMEVVAANAQDTMKEWLAERSEE